MIFELPLVIDNVFRCNALGGGRKSEVALNAQLSHIEKAVRGDGLGALNRTVT